MAYTPYYSGGWQSGEEGGTPITPDALNHMEEGIAGAVAKSGDTMTGNLYIKKNTPAVFFTNSNGSTWAAMIYEVVDSGDNNRLALAIRKEGSAGQEIYFLPVPDEHSSQTNYGILTTKNAVAVVYGGTGASSADDARYNLNVPYGMYTEDSTWATLWTNCLSKIHIGRHALLLLSNAAASVLSNGKITSLIGAIVFAGGTASSRSFRIMAMSDTGSMQYSWYISNANATSRTTGTVYKFAGTAM